VPGVLEELLDKGRLSVLLEQNRIDHARTWRVETERELESLDDDQLRSVFIKPRDTQRFHARYGVKSMSPSGRDAIWKTLDRLRGEGLEVVLQEYVPGPPTHGYLLEGFVDGGGTVRAVLARQRLRMHPPNFGNSSAARSIPPEEAAPAEQALRRLLHAVRYRGIFNMEFKKDARDGSFRLLDVNPRAWWHVEFAARCGVDVVHMAYRDALGLSVDSVESYEVGRTVIYPYYDLFACYRAWKSGETGLGACVRSWVGADQMIFARDDPRPFFGATLRLWVNYARRRLPGFTEAGMDHTGTSSPGQ
jgi:predicted ATP-grasp superfamily ATP-dependent carboligase